MTINRMMAGALGAVVLAGTASAQVTAAEGYAVQSLTTPGVVQGGSARRDGMLIVGQGDFGPGLASIVRIENGQATTIATGFGGLGGVDLAEDGTLYVVDNCYVADFGCEAATTGDTVYAIPEALTRTTPIAAADAELLPAGSIGVPFDVIDTPSGLLVSDSAGPGAGRVVRVEGTGVVDVVTGLDYPAGLAFDDPSLFVANATAAFTGQILEFLGASPEGAVIDGLAGAAGLAIDAESDLLLGAGTELLEVDFLGFGTAIASGFGYAGDVSYDAEADAALVLDFGVTAVTLVCLDEDGDAVCDGTCSEGAPLEDAALSLKPGKEAGAGSLKLKAELRILGGLASDPTLDGMALQLLDANGVRALEVRLPGGAAWKAKKKNRGWRFRDKTGALRITDVSVTPSRGDDEVVKVVVRSRKHLPVDTATLALPLRTVVTFDPLGECGASAFAGCEEKGESVRCE
jgi:hypothetical protein